MPPRRQKRHIDSYQHRDHERLNNPPVGLVTPDTDKDADKKTYQYDPHLDPQLQWAGKAEHTSFEVPTVSLHVHERIDPRTIIEATRKRNGNGLPQMPLFESPEENPPVRDAIEFYKHRHNWSNRLISGDSLLVMNSLLEKEGMAGKVQMIYIDPPYGIRYGSNFQPFVNQRSVQDGRDEDLNQEPETIKAFRDTWDLGVHSYLSYLRDRLLLARDLLSTTGSCFLQISDENVHRVRSIMDEVFGAENFVAHITYKVTSGFERSIGPRRVQDYIVWYAKQKEVCKSRRIFKEKVFEELNFSLYRHVEQDGIVRPLTPNERQNPTRIGKNARVFTTMPLHAMGTAKRDPREFEGGSFTPPPNTQWRHTDSLFESIVKVGRVVKQGSRIRSKSYWDDFPYEEYNTVWLDTGPEMSKSFVVQTSAKVIQRCMLMTTDPGDLVFDPTCGSGTTAYVAEQWGRRWITCDTSRVAVSLAKQRLMTSIYDYYQLAHPPEGVGSGFSYRTVPRITLGSIADNLEIATDMSRSDIDAAIARNSPQETLYDQPVVDNGKKRVTGPFSVEAVPAPSVQPVDDVSAVEPSTADTSIARSGESTRQSDWRDELLRTGIRGKLGQYIRFVRLEPLPGSPVLHNLHADGESMPNDDGPNTLRDGAASTAQRIVVSFGPEHAPLEQRQVERAIEEAETLVPRPRVIVFAAFQFDPEAAKDIDETNWPGVTLLKAQMNPDMLTEDLKKKRASNESFWLVGQPDVYLHLIRRGPNTGKYQVQVRGFDYYNTKNGEVESGGEDRIALWMLDTDYDGRNLYPQQVFFPLSGNNDGWSRLARNLRAEIDEDLIEAYRGTLSLPFEMGDNQRVAVKIVDDRGIESLRIMSAGEVITMLTGLNLTNFRIFDDEVTVRFRPITILIGKNSAGKSTIVKFLLMLQQSLDLGRSQFLTSEGEKVDLGLFADLKNTKTNKRNLMFELCTEDIGNEPQFAISQYLTVIGANDRGKLSHKAGGSVPYGSTISRARAFFLLSDKVSGRNFIRASPPNLDDSRFWDRPPPPEEFDVQTSVSGTDQSSDNHDRDTDPRRMWLRRWVAETAIVDDVSHQVSSLRHLLPVRDESQRVIVTTSWPRDDVGQSGRFAIPHLHQIVQSRAEQYQFILPHLKSIAGIRDVKFDTASGYITRAIGINEATGAEVLLADFGFGVGQCLPIIVQGAIMDPYTTLMVEQPEAQLHPTAQLELGSYFADLWKKRNVASIIETHSDNILLRLRRLIAKGDLSHEDVSVAFFTFDDENDTMPIIKNLDINEDGSMEAGLPMEFFGADIIEGLSLGAKT